MFVPDERVWLRDSVEARRFRPPADPIDGRELLDRITRVEVFERFLHRTFPGKTRFSIEGLDMMIPILDEIIADAAASGVKHVLIAMAHRGRLNVLAHVMQKPYAQILAEFKDPLFAQERPDRARLDGRREVPRRRPRRARRRARRRSSSRCRPTRAISRPSTRCSSGMARAAATAVDAPGAPSLRTDQVLGILIHGDAAFPGQGVVAETLNLSRLAGWDVGGTIHLIANNQLGFTADPHEAFSTSYASGLARGFKVPIVHVNADDAECVHRGGAAGLGLPPAIRARLPDRSRRLPPLRPQRGRRAGVHPAADLPAGGAAPDRARSGTREALVASGADRRRGSRRSWSAAHAAVLERTYAALKPEQDYVPDVPVVPPSGAAAKVRTAVPLDRLAR